MNNKKFTYKKSGVNINAADSFVSFISKISSKNKGKKKFSNIGSFGSINSIPNNIKHPQITHNYIYIFYVKQHKYKNILSCKYYKRNSYYITNVNIIMYAYAYDMHIATSRFLLSFIYAYKNVF